MKRHGGRVSEDTSASGKEASQRRRRDTDTKKPPLGGLDVFHRHPVVSIRPGYLSVVRAMWRPVIDFLYQRLVRKPAILALSTIPCRAQHRP